MNKSILILIVSIFFVFGGFGIAYAQTTYSTQSNEEKEIDAVSSSLDKESKELGEAKKVEEGLKEKFNVNDARIDDLRNQKLGYGEISTVFSFAKQMPGGINDQNIQKIMNLRQAGENKEGWGKIAEKLGLKLQPAVKDMNEVYESL